MVPSSEKIILLIPSNGSYNKLKVFGSLNFPVISCLYIVCLEVAVVSTLRVGQQGQVTLHPMNCIININCKYIFICY